MLIDYEKDLEDILKTVREYYPRFGEKEADKIKKAFLFSQEAHKGQLRKSGIPYFVHPVMATKTLLEIKPDIETIQTCLLHDVIEDTPITEEDIKREFGETVLYLCNGVTKVSRMSLNKNASEAQLANIRKLFLAVAEDIRVIFVKIADRIHNLSTLEHLPPDRQKEIAGQSMNVYAPIAEILGLYRFKKQIQDLSFKFLQPEDYKRLHHELELYNKEQEIHISKIEIAIRDLFKKHDFPVLKIKSRQKHLYSVYQKMKRKNVNSPWEIFDIYAFRVVVPKTEDCYRALGILHSEWKPIPTRFKDYISVPKANGYQSLHTTMLGVGQSPLPTEIQIKTEKMSVDAEWGPAAHWAYKGASGKSFDEEYTKKMGWLQEDLTSAKLKSSQSFFNALSSSILKERIIVFSPKGDIVRLPQKATPIDFAYAIHSEVGHTCMGAKVDGVIRPLDYPLKTGNVVEILTRQGRKPNGAWLNFAVTTSARQKIKAEINRLAENRAEVYKEGLEAEIAEAKRKRFATPVTRPTQSEEKLPGKYNIVIGGQEGLSYRLAKCCAANPGESIIAYNSRGTEFVIHKENCRVAQKLDSERMMEANFIMQRKFSIYAKDRKGLMNDYSATMSGEGFFIWDIKFRRLKNNRVVWTFVVNVPSDRMFQEMIKKIRNISNVLEIKMKLENEK